MKKLIKRIIVIVLLLIIVGVVAVLLCLDRIVKKGIETVGPKLTQVSVTVEGVHISVFGGSGSIKGLMVGNPAGYQTSNSISIGKAGLALKLGSILSDKVVIKSIEVKSPEITFEQTLSGNNILALLHNVEGAGSSDANSSTSPSKPPKKLQVDDFLISGAKVKATAQGLGGKTFDVTIPDIHLTNLGTSEGGITAAELIKRVLGALETEVAKAGADILKNAGTEALKEQGGKVLDDVKGKASDGIGNLFKKK